MKFGKRVPVPAEIMDFIGSIPPRLVIKALAMVPTAPKQLLIPKGWPADARANILADTNQLPWTPGMTEVHMHQADYWIGIEGELTFVVGGDVPGCRFRRTDAGINRNEIQADRIDGGQNFVLRHGDRLYIPAGIPHVHWGTGRAWIAKVDESAVFGRIPKSVNELFAGFA